MKNLFLLSFLFISVVSFAADRYWVGGGTNTNWNSSPTTNWSATSGGANNASVPTSTDDVIFDGVGLSGNTNSTISSAITVLSLNITSGYTATMTHNGTLTVAGNVTFHSGYTIAGTSQLTISATSTITSGGKTWPNNITFTGSSAVKTLVGNFVIGGALTVSNVQSINATTSETLSCNGLSNNSGTLSGTAKIILTGGNWSGTQPIQNNLDIAGNVTLTFTGAVYNTGTMTYVSGTVTANGTLTISASTTLNTAGITWNNVTLSASQTLTLNSLLTASGTLLLSNPNTSTTFAGSFGFSVHTFSMNNTNAVTMTFNDGVTYTITNALSCFSNRIGAASTFTSDHATNKAIITLDHGATCNVLAHFTRIDASAGRTIRTFNGTITGCTNIFEFHDLPTIRS